MYSTTLLLGVTSLILASTAHAQVADRALLNLAPIGHGSARTAAPSASVLSVTGERALLGTFEHRVSAAEPASATHAPTDGARALLGRWPSPISTGPRGRSGQFRLSGNIRGDVSADALTAASDRLLTGRFEVDAIGFRAAEPERENRP